MPHWSSNVLFSPNGTLIKEKKINWMSIIRAAKHRYMPQLETSRRLWYSENYEPEMRSELRADIDKHWTWPTLRFWPILFRLSVAPKFKSSKSKSTCSDIYSTDRINSNVLMIVGKITVTVEPSGRQQMIYVECLGLGLNSEMRMKQKHTHTRGRGWEREIEEKKEKRRMCD